MDKQLSRKKSRENAFILLFSASFGGGTDEAIAMAREEQNGYEVDAFGEELIKLYTSHTLQIDKTIEDNLKGWKLGRISRVNLAILRLSTAEILYGGQGLESVVINEAVETAKRFGDESDYQFINGVLGSIFRAGCSGEEETNEPAFGATAEGGV